ncbi:MAG: ribonuclease P protein component [Bdellovibrionales bacterium RIFOXYA1_FULL_36_14]|nr:MAG: ribonuclease P protein component [Bdellovibrionales bacterium RIFOXYA1_FULL_36_14]
MTCNSFSKDFRLLKPRDYENLKNERLVIRRKFLSAYYKKSKIDSEQTRIGISVSRKVGKSNFRNLLKRLIRENFRTSVFKNLGKDISFVVSTRCKIDDIMLFKKMVLDILLDISKNDHK